MRPLLPFSVLLSIFDHVHAVRIPFQVRTLVENSWTSVDRLGRRAPTNNIPIKNIHNAQYVSNFTIGDQQVALMLDTGRYVPERMVTEAHSSAADSSQL